MKRATDGKKVGGGGKYLAGDRKGEERKERGGGAESYFLQNDGFFPYMEKWGR